MIVMAIDPGYERSAWVVWDGSRIINHGINENRDVLDRLTLHSGQICQSPLVIEKIEGFGMAVGREVFETVWWSGRFHQAWDNCDHSAERLSRKAVKLHLCESTRATDANIRTALCDRFGGKTAAIGTKRQPGPLYGIKSHEWSALALAITWFDQQSVSHEERKAASATAH